MSPPIIGGALLAVVLWGASPVAAKVALIDLPPLAVAVLRTVVGGLVALPLLAVLRIPLPETWSARFVLALSGLCGFIAFPLLFTVGLGLTSANHASMILAGLPIFTGAIAMAWDRTRPKRRWWLGCAIALGGELLLVGTRSVGGPSPATVPGDLLVLASNVLASLGYVAGGRLQRAGYPSTGTTFWGVAIGAIILLPLVPLVFHGIAVAAVPARAWLAVAYIAVGVTIVGYLLWYWALGRGGIERMGLFQFLQPISGVLLAFLLLGEGLSSTFVLASALILAGIWLALRAK
jgi:drug/metabolite transporter (DMT)-like permease